MSAPSAKALFRATKPKGPNGPRLFTEAALPPQTAPSARDPLDYDPTPSDATEAFLAVEGKFIHAHDGPVWESAVGGGHMANVIRARGHVVIGSDIVDRGWQGMIVRSLYDFSEAPARKMITNPPYCEINARDGHGRWLRHALGLGCDYIALLLNADWAAARINGLDELMHDHPPSVEYLCCWKIDFRGGGSPPQRNSWFVWDKKRPALGANTWVRSRLYREVPDPRQEAMF